MIIQLFLSIYICDQTTKKIRKINSDHKRNIKLVVRNMENKL